MSVKAAKKSDKPEANAVKEWFSTMLSKRIRFVRLISQSLFFILFSGVIFGLPRISFPAPVVLPTGSPYSTMWGGFTALQYILAVGQFPFLVLGVFFLTGAIFGKLTCGWACPIGFWQDFLALFPLSKTKISKPLNRDLTEFSGFFLWLAVIISGFFGFQRLQGELTGGEFWTFIPYGILDPSSIMFVTYYFAMIWGVLGAENMLDIAGTWFFIKTFILILFTYISIKIPRAYCRWICPTGALLGYMSKNSVLTIKKDPTKCVDGCKDCEKACPTDVPISEEDPSGISNVLCINCGDCIDACPDALSFGFRI